MLMGRRAAGEGQIRRRHDGRWEARVWVTLPSGKTKRLSLCAGTQKACRDKLQEARRRHGLGLPPTDVGETLGKYLDRWLRHTAAPRVRPATALCYQQVIDDHLKRLLGRRPLAKLTPAAVDTALDTMKSEGLSPRTRQLTLGVLRMALKTAERRGEVARNVATLVDGPRVPRRPVTPLSVEEARTLLAHLRGAAYEQVIVVTLAMGVRKGEALGLRWRDVDLERGVARVVHSLQQLPGETWKLVEVKSETSRRVLPLPALAVAMLKAQRARQREERMRAGPLWTEHDFVFTRPTGEPLSPSQVYKVFAVAMEASVKRHLRFHDLRHSAASFLIAQGAHPKEIQAQLGHSTIKVTMDTYGHLFPESERRAADRMDALNLEGGAGGGQEGGKGS